MGQKTSTFEDTRNVMLPTHDSPELGMKSKKCANKKIEPISIQDVKDDFADVRKLIKSKKQQHKLESSDEQQLAPHGDGDGISEITDARKKSNLIGKLLDEYVRDEGGEKSNNGRNEIVDQERYIARTCLNPDFLPLLDNPSIAELSQLTALKMMQNFEEFAKLDQFWKSQVSAVDEKTMDDNVSEKDFRMINYEELPTVQLCENDTSLKHDSSTTTHEVRDAVQNYFDVDDDEEAEEKSCKESTTSDQDEPEMLELRTRVSRLELERDEAMLRMRNAEERCEEREAESRCLEATLGIMEDKLRDIVSELSEEVKRSRSLEMQLTRSLQESSLGGGHMDALASVD